MTQWRLIEKKRSRSKEAIGMGLLGVVAPTAVGLLTSAAALLIRVTAEAEVELLPMAETILFPIVYSVSTFTDCYSWRDNHGERFRPRAVQIWSGIVIVVSFGGYCLIGSAIYESPVTPALGRYSSVVNVVILFMSLMSLTISLLVRVASLPADHPKPGRRSVVRRSAGTRAKTRVRRT